jgi:hypothetical protein
MKIKELEINDYVKLKNFLKENISFADNILMDMPQKKPLLINDIVLRVYIFDKNLENKISFIINNDETNNYLEILDGYLKIELIQEIVDYIQQNLITKINIII